MATGELSAAVESAIRRSAWLYELQEVEPRYEALRRSYKVTSNAAERNRLERAIVGLNDRRNELLERLWPAAYPRWDRGEG